MKPVEALHASQWHAALELAFRSDGQRSWLAHRRHSGPLVVQRSFYPEDSRLCQMVIVHPPGGIAGGDQLELQILAEEQACAQLTTPGAGKWYRGFGRNARQSVRIQVAREAMCEWLPQENIVFDGALAGMSLEVELASGAVFCGWDFTCLGRPHSDQYFVSGAVRQSTVIKRPDGVPLFREQARISAGDDLCKGPSILANHCSYGTMLVAGAKADDGVIDAAREVISKDVNAGISRIGDVLVARWVGNNIEAGRNLFTRLWSVLRPWYAGREVVMPRIWAT